MTQWSLRRISLLLGYSAAKTDSLILEWQALLQSLQLYSPHFVLWMQVLFSAFCATEQRGSRRASRGLAV